MQFKDLATTFSSHFHRIRLLLNSYGISLPNPFNLLIWILGFLLMCGLTLKEVIPLVDDYHNHNEAINVSIVLIDDTFKSPPMAVHIPLYLYEYNPTYGTIDSNPVPQDTEVLLTITRHLRNGTDEECDECKKLREVGWDVWKGADVQKYLNGSVNTSYNSLWLAFADKMLSTFDRNYLTEEYSKWNSALFSSAINFLAWQGRVDCFNKQVDLGAPELSSKLASLVSSHSNKLDQFYSRVLRAVCQTISFEEHDSATEFDNKILVKNTCEDLITNVPMDNVLLDGQGLWIPLPTFTTPLIKRYHFTLWRNNNSFQSVWYPQPDTIHMPFYVYPDHAIIYTTTSDRVFTSRIVQTSVDQTKYGHYVTIRYGVQMRAKESRKKKHDCGGTSAAMCYTKCTKQMIMESCGCVPFYFRKGITDKMNGPFCNSGDYELCNASYAEPRRDHCLRKCQSSCEFSSYSWQVEYDTFQPTNPDSMELILKTVPVINSFTEFSWMEKNTKEQFIAQMAGIANLYLGFDGLILVAGLIWLIELIKKLRKRKSVNVSTETWALEKTMAREVMSDAQFKKFEENMQVWFGKLKEELISCVETGNERDQEL